MSFDFVRAQHLARTWFATCDARGQIKMVEGDVLTRPYGWVFFGAPADALDGIILGMPAIIVDRINGDIHVLNASFLEDGIARYEASVTPARLSLQAEPPPGDPAAFRGPNAVSYAAIRPERPGLKQTLRRLLPKIFRP